MDDKLKQLIFQIIKLIVFAGLSAIEAASSVSGKSGVKIKTLLSNLPSKYK